MPAGIHRPDSDIQPVVGIQFGIFSPDEIEKRSVVEITNSGTYDGNEPNCQPVIAKCPKGTKLIKPLSKCSASAKSYYGNEVSISSNSWDAPFVLISDANYQEGFQQCNLNAN